MGNRFKKRHIMNSSSSVFIATFSHYQQNKRLPTNGMVEPMLSFFQPVAKNILLLDQPHPVSDSIGPIVEIYNKDKLKKRFIISPLFYLPIYLLCKIPSKNTTRISYKIRDFFSVIFIGLISKDKYDVFIGLESINVLAGLFLRKIGKIKTVVYYVSDYSPERFGKTLFNSFYLWLDQFCVKHADFTWDVSEAMKEGRIKAGLLPQEMRRVIHVPNGLFPSQIDPLPISQRIRDSIVYMGILDPDVGIDLILEAFSLVKRKHPYASLHIVGGTNEDIVRLSNIASRLRIKKSIIFYGFIPPDKRMSSIIKSCYIGVSAYTFRNASRNKYGDSGKIRQYLGCGLPIVATNLQAYTNYVIKKGAGIGTKETAEDLANGILSLLKDDKLYEQCCKKAIELGKNNTWKNSYTNAFLDMQKIGLKN